MKKTNKQVIITGPTGHIGSYLMKELGSRGMSVISDKIDYTSPVAVSEVFEKTSNTSDTFIIHTAHKNVRNYKYSTQDDYNTNLFMATTISSFAGKRRIINLDSWARLGLEMDLYTLAKKQIRKKFEENNLTNIVVPGTFHISEGTDRLLSKALLARIQGTPIEIQDKQWCLVSYEDVLKVILNTIENDCYSEKDIFFKDSSSEFLSDYIQKMEDFISQRMILPESKVTITEKVSCSMAAEYAKQNSLLEYVDFETRFSDFFYSFVNEHDVRAVWK